MNLIFKTINKIIYSLLIVCIIFYQKIISPILPARCRYYPTCSNYGKQALAWHGTSRGSWLLIRRISRCHPLGGHGIDFVPLPLASYLYLPLDKLDTAKVASPLMFKGSSIYRDNSSYVARLNHLLEAY